MTTDIQQCFEIYFASIVQLTEFSIPQCCRIALPILLASRSVTSNVKLYFTGGLIPMLNKSYYHHVRF